MKSLQDLGFEFVMLDNEVASLKKVVDKGYEEIHIDVNFVDETIKFITYFPDSNGQKFQALHATLELLEASLEFLKSRKVEFNYE